MQDKARKKISSHELDSVLMNHRQWLESSGNLGRRAELNGIDLSSRDLFGAILTRAIIEEVLKPVLLGEDPNEVQDFREERGGEMTFVEIKELIKATPEMET